MIHFMNMESSKSLKLFPRITVCIRSLRRIIIRTKPPIGTTTLLQSVSIVVHIAVPQLEEPVKLAGWPVRNVEIRPSLLVVLSNVSVIKSEMLSNWDFMPSLNKSSHHSCKLSIASLMTPIISPSFHTIAHIPPTTQPLKLGQIILHLSSCSGGQEQVRLQGG